MKQLWVVVVILLALSYSLLGQNPAVTTAQYNTGRTAANLSETVLNTSTVNVNDFGKLFSWQVDNYIFAQPLYVPNLNINGSIRNVIFVATMGNSVYAFDAGQSGSTPLWHVQLGTPVTIAGPSCPVYYDANGYSLGILSTPVIDTATNTLYAVSSNQGNNGYSLYLHALDILTGNEKTSAVLITPFTDTLVQRTALLLANNRIYAGLGSCGPDLGIYHGTIVVHDKTSLAQIASFNVTPNGNEGGIWQSGGGGVADSAGNVYFNTGNETLVGGDYASKVLKLSSSASVLASFSPSNAALLNYDDLDISSAGPLQIPGTSTLLSGGKEGIVYVLAENNLSLQQNLQATQYCTDPTNGCYQIHQLAFWNNRLYVWGGNDILRSYIWSNGVFSTGPQNSTTILADTTGAPLAVSANGTQPGTGILWAIDTSGIVHAFDATNIATELWNSNMNAGRDALPSRMKYAIPTIVNGRVYVPTRSNQLVVYGLLPPTDFTMSVSPTSQTVPAGDSTEYVIEVDPLFGFSGTAALTVSGLPGGVTGTFNPPSITASGSSTLAVTTAASARLGTATIAINGSSGSLRHSTPATLTVAPPSQGGGGTSGLSFFPVTPCRLVDTRSSTMPASFGPPRMMAGQPRSFAILASPCGVPAGAAAYSLNVTVVPASTLGYLSLWPTGTTQPLVSTLNSPNGQIVANAAIVPAGTGGSITLVVSDNADVIIDIDGYFAPNAGTGLAFYPVTPCRVADTRQGTGFTGAFGPPALAAAQTRSFPIPSASCGIPSSARAYSLNLTVVPPAPLGYLSVWPTGQTQPGVSTINALDGRVVANAAIVPAGANGAINVFASDATNLLIDIDGYFAPQGATGALYLYTVSPCRVADTRASSGFTGSFGPPSLAATVQRSFPIQSSSCGIPTTSRGYSLNLTVVPPGPLGYLSVWPAGKPQPVVSTLNALNGSVVANAAIVPSGTSGAISVFASNNTDLIIDINAYFAP